MNKFIFTILLLLVLLTGCSTPTDNNLQDASSTSPIEDNTQTSTQISAKPSEQLVSEAYVELETAEPQNNSEIRYAEMIPDPETIFANGVVSIIDSDGGKAYIFQVTDYEDGEYEVYVSGCKALGFNDVSYESQNEGGKMYGAYTADGKYWVEVLLGNDTKNIAVTCQESKKK